MRDTKGAEVAVMEMGWREGDLDGVAVKFREAYLVEPESSSCFSQISGDLNFNIQAEKKQ